MRKRGHAEQSAAASVIGFAIRVGVVIRHAALVVMVNGAVRMGMRQALMLRWRAHFVQLIKTVERSRTSGDREGGRRRQNANRVGQCDQYRRPGTKDFCPTTHDVSVYQFSRVIIDAGPALWVPKISSGEYFYFSWLNSLFLRHESLLHRNNSLIHYLGNFALKPSIYGAIWRG